MTYTKIASGTTLNIVATIPKSITEYENILMAVYTNQNTAVKCSYVEKAGFNKIEDGDIATELKVTINSAQTAKMDGCIYYEIKLVDALTPSENIADSLPIDLGIKIITNVLKSIL